MRHNRSNISYEFRSGLTPLCKNLLIIYATIYVLELVVKHWMNIPLVSYLMLWPVRLPDFHLWQIFTHPFIHDPSSPIAFLIDCVVLYFFVGPVESVIGTRRFLTLFYLAAFGGALCGMVFSGVSGFNAPFSGMMPSLLAVIVVFGFLNPEATILLMFVLPLKAKYLSYGTIVVTALMFLAKASPNGAFHLGGILCGYIYFKGPRNIINFNLLYLKYLEWKLKRKRSRFHVVDGFKDEKDKDNDKPTYH
jgi:membrane associated rhomboid family serine protease